MIERYAVYWVSLDPAAGRETKKTRPCVVVSHNAMHVTGMAVVCPLTSRLHPQWAHRMQIRCAGKPAEIMADQIRAISHERFGKKLDTLSPSSAKALRVILGRLYVME